MVDEFGNEPPEAAGSAAGRPLPPELNPRGPQRTTAPDPLARGARRPPKGPKPRRSRRRRILTWAAGSVAAVLLLSSVTGYAIVSHLLSGITHLNVFCDNCKRPSGGVKGDLNILLVGSDSRNGLTQQQRNQLHVGKDVGQRSDTMILLHIPRGGGRAVLVSLPRDSLVTIPRHQDSNGHWIPAQQSKLNNAYSFGGAKLTVQTVEYNTHVRIDHYVEVNFLGFVNIVNALHGVTVCTPTPIHDPVHRLPGGGWGGSGLELPAGKSTLNGARALEYVRAREFDPTADLGRIQRQQKFMAAMVQKAKSAGILLNPVRLYDLVGAVGKSLTTDKNFGIAQIKDLASNLHSMSPAHIEMLRVPLKPGSFNMGSIGNVVEWDPAASHRLFRDLTLDKPVGPVGGNKPKVTFPPSSVTLQVLNATGTQGFAARAASDLAKFGFHVSGTGNAPKSFAANQTVIHYGPNRGESAHTLAASVPGATLQLDPNFGNGLQLILGSNYKGARAVSVISSTDSGTITAPRTAAQDICS